MASFGAIASPFADPNALFDQAKADTAIANQQINALNMQGARQQQAGTEMEYLARAAQGVLELEDEQQPAAYQAAVRQLQQYGFAMNAPAYDKAMVQRVAMLGIPSKDQYTTRQNREAGQAYLGTGGGGGPAPAPGTVAAPGAAPGAAPVAIPPRGTGGPGATAQMPLEWMQFYREASAETGIPVDVLIAQHRQESGFNPKARGAAGEIGLGQIKPSTARDPGYGMTGVDPATLEDPRTNIMFSARYLKARGGQGDWNNPAVQARALAAYNGGGDPNYVANVNRYRPSMSPTDPGTQMTTYTPEGPPTATAGGPGTGRVQVASVTPTTMTDGTTAPPAAPAVAPGAAAPAPVAGGTTPAPAAAPAPAQPPAAQIPPPPQFNAQGRTRLQQQQIEAAHRRGAAVSDLATMDARFADDNRAEVAAWQARVQQQQTNQRAEVSARNDAERLRIQQAEFEAKQHEGLGVLYRIAPKILDGTATDAERREYSATMQDKFTRDRTEWVDDPSRPGTKIPQTIPGKIPEGFPAPSYRPGQPLVEPPKPTQTKTAEVKVLPEAERKALLEQASRLDQIVEQRSTFKPDYGGFLNATVGELANTAARNLPASPKDIARAEWWQNYQRMKLAVRQGISGQSLTASELGEFDKADINPGMTEKTIRDNLAHQEKLLRTAHERRIGSLAADRYSPEAIKAAGGIDPAQVTAPQVGSSAAPQPEQKPLPPGWKVVVP